MKAIIGRKIEMTQIFTPDGVVLPVTKIKAEPVTVTQIKTVDKDGYTAVQIASGNKRKVSKSLLGHFKGNKYRFVREFKIEVDNIKVGDTWGVNIFEEGEKAKAVGTSKGKGFQGVVKRWGFHGSPASHGHKDQLRMPGSIGATGPARVFKGTRMGGHMGATQMTSKWLEIVRIDEDNNIIYIKGSVPGARNSIVYITTETEFKLPDTNKHDANISALPNPELIEGVGRLINTNDTNENEQTETTKEKSEPARNAAHNATGEEKPKEQVTEEKPAEEKTEDRKEVKEVGTKGDEKIEENKTDAQ